MRRMTSMLTILAAAGLLSGSTLMADDANYDSNAGKDECLLLAMNCEQSVDSIQMRVERLNKEIAKGADVYTRDELNVLKRKLEEVNKQLETIISGG